ncbi:stealth family protein [Gallibacterium sp. AGMB14963]|uniref:stealth family protein n=1 Tax=Gallibacterium faecale TaxID=3019086 RepID=UPI0022F16359|nr:stealth family protein [Gallibacterium sp. AGMB14963]MDA3978221.1 stealth family protein [Gallibacterium sp. AGMB14963]
MKKIRKFLFSPGEFFRDYLIKKYPFKNTELYIPEDEEYLFIKAQEIVGNLEHKLYSTESSEIDVVYTWVDNSDVNWLKKYQETKSIFSEKSFSLYALDPARFTNHDELYYSLISIKKYMPWIRKIHIVTDGQKPKLPNNINTENIYFIDHKEIIDSQYLPTFNSHVIEAHLHNIPDLSENFIYFNDDVFTARMLPREHFFRNNGIASIFISPKKLSIKKVLTPTLCASLNSSDLLYKDYGIKITNSLIHTYIPLKKSIYTLVWNRHKDLIDTFLNNRFRNNQDLNLATFLVPWVMYLEGKAVFSQDICYYFNIRSAHAQTQYTKLLQKNQQNLQPHSFCANDFNSQSSICEYRENLISMLESYYCNK